MWSAKLRRRPVETFSSCRKSDKRMIKYDKSFGLMQWSTGTNLAPTRCSFGGKGWGWPTMGFCGSHKLFFCGDITSTTMVYHHMFHMFFLWFILKFPDVFHLFSGWKIPWKEADADDTHPFAGVERRRRGEEDPSPPGKLIIVSSIMLG